MVNTDRYLITEFSFLARLQTTTKNNAKVFSGIIWQKVAIIVDCFEIFIECTSNLCARATTWSNYKHKNTAKVLIGISPQGVVTYVSEAWGSRVNDKHLTETVVFYKT